MADIDIEDSQWRELGEADDELKTLVYAVAECLKGHTAEAGLNALVNVAVNVVNRTGGSLEDLKTFMVTLVDVHIAHDKTRFRQSS